MTCICGLPSDTPDCCGRYLEKRAWPATAEALMRSRYSAYVTGDVDYLLSTHNPATVGETNRKVIEEWARSTQWQGLQVVATEDGQAWDDVGQVEFVARYLANGQPGSHHERSTFHRIAGKWYFTEGVLLKPAPEVRDSPKTGRNDPCPCGSGRKYKKCCGST